MRATIPLPESGPILRPLRRAASITLVLAFLVGCQEREQVNQGVARDTSSLQMQPANPSEQLQTGMAGDSVRVTLTEYDIQMPSSVQAGPTIFVVTNGGTMPHNFEIEGGGIEASFPNPLPAGAVQSIRVDLQPGTYTVYCPVADHEDQGMSLTLNVETAEMVDTARTGDL